MSTPNISYVRNEASALLKIWWMIRDAIEGEPAIKAEHGIRATYIRTQSRPHMASEFYLPKPNPTDKSQENEERYAQYVKRAVWYSFTARTLAGMTGQIFLRPPVSKLPTTLDAMTKNADGEGMTLEQVAKRTAQSCLAYGRAGLYTDYPSLDSAATVEQKQKDGVQPVIRHYYPWQIINWATARRGVKHVLSLVVLEELFMESVDGFEFAESFQYRVLKLDSENWVYSVEVWGMEEIKDQDALQNSGDPKEKKTQFVRKEQFIPTDNEGKTFDEIPFSFVGSEANDIWPDVPPMQDLATLNIAHYRNSADYEESCFLCGQPTPVISGLTAEWVENVLKGAIQLGSRGSIPLPVGADAKLLQASPNQMPLEAMRMKEDQALALGAKLVQTSAMKRARTATEVMIDTTSEGSTLHNVAKNTSAAMEQNLTWAAQYAGGDASEIQYQLNTEFELTRMNANDRLALIKMWQCGAICFDEMRAVLKVDGTASMDDAEAFAQIQKEQAAAATLGGAPIADPFQEVTPLAPTNNPKTGQEGQAQ